MTIAVRLLMYGGAKNKAHNSAFYYASLNVQKDYANDMTIKSIFISNGTHQIISEVNKQAENSIQSIDLFSHGSEYDVFLSMGVSMDKSLTNAKQSNLYTNLPAKAYDIVDRPTLIDTKDQYTVSDLKVSKFTNACKIEIHGCTTAGAVPTSIVDNLCENLSEHLFSGGKKRAVVIGHFTKANPNINGEGKTKIAEQDYRHGTRRIYHNGKLIGTYTQKGRISAKAINEMLAKAGVK